MTSLDYTILFCAFLAFWLWAAVRFFDGLVDGCGSVTDATFGRSVRRAFIPAASPFVVAWIMDEITPTQLLAGLLGLTPRGLEAWIAAWAPTAFLVIAGAGALGGIVTSIVVGYIADRKRPAQ